MRLYMTEHLSLYIDRVDFVQTRNSAMKRERFLTICVIVVGYSLRCNNAPVSVAVTVPYKRLSGIETVNDNCSEARHQQIQEWMPEYCPSMREAFIEMTDRCDVECGKRCGQYFYEGLKECYGFSFAFLFEQLLVVSETGVHCIDLANNYWYLSSLRDFCNSETYNVTFCASKCSDRMQYLSEVYGCCFPTFEWLMLDLPTPQDYISIQSMFNICNVSFSLCAPVFSHSLPPDLETDTTETTEVYNNSTVDDSKTTEVHDNSTFSDNKSTGIYKNSTFNDRLSVDIGLATGLSIVALMILSIISTFLTLLLIARTRKKKKRR